MTSSPGLRGWSHLETCSAWSVTDVDDDDRWWRQTTTDASDRY